MFEILLIHGAWGSPEIMKSLSVGLQERTDKAVTSIQLVGHGNEAFTHEMGSFGLEDYVNDIHRKLPAGRKVIVVGHSMGGVCGFNLAQAYPEIVQGVVMIDPPKLGGGADIRVTKALLSNWRRYIWPLLTNGLFVPTREDAKMMLYNGEESHHLDSIIRQPAAGRVIRQMLVGRLPTQSKRPCGLVIAEDSRLHPSKNKLAWAQKAHAHCIALAGSHCGVLANNRMPQIIHDLVERVSL